MRWRRQNLNEKRNGETGTALRHGRAWLHFAWVSLAIEWVTLDRRFALEVSCDADEGEIGWIFSVPGISLYGTLSGALITRLYTRLGMDYVQRRARRKNEHDFDHLYSGKRSIGVRIHDWALWWSCLERDGSWSSSDPWWMHGCFRPAEFFLGREQYSTETLEEREVMIPMPERSYPAKATLKLATWKRPRWPFAQQRTTVSIDVPEGLPVPGKGENSWDCGPDAIYGQSGPATSIEEAIGNAVASALRDRKRRGAADNYSERAIA